MVNKEIARRLKKELEVQVKQNSIEGILLSGGLDSSILSSFVPGVSAFTVSLENHGDDVKYASKVAQLFGLRHYIKIITIKEAIDVIPEVIKILHTFDLALPNDIAIYFALKLANSHKIKKIMTGDGGDELFAGYSYMHKLNDLEGYIQGLAKRMHFSSQKLGQAFGIKIIQPYINEEFIKFALSIPIEVKVKRLSNGKVWGKWIMREAFKDALPKEIVWRDKIPIEYGSGMTRLRKIISLKVSDPLFKKAKKNLGIKFINKEHYYYYKIYAKVIGKIPHPKKGEKKCPCCGAGVSIKNSHCKICGSSEV
jgi:asparagine synthase (glutamine-hydrolysing)